MRNYFTGQPKRPPAYDAQASYEAKPIWPLRILRSIGRILRGTIMLIGTVGLLLMMLGAYSSYQLIQKQGAAHGNMPAPSEMGPTVLFWAIERPIPDVPDAPSFAQPLGGGSLTTRGIADRLFEAAKDKNISALYVSYRGAPVDLTQVEEWRPALKALRKAGKKTVFFASDLGMGPGAMNVYLLATEFERIVMLPTSSLSMTGMAVEMPFAGDTLGKLGIQPQIVQRKEYKTAFENITASKMSDANREMTTALLGDVYGQILNNMAANRKLSVTAIQAQIDRGIVTAEEAKAAKLVDAVNYSDKEIEALQKSLVAGIPDPLARAAATENVGFLEMADYYPESMPAPRKPSLAQILRGQKPNPPLDPNQPKIALIDISGAIVLSDGKQALAPSTSPSTPIGMGGSGLDAIAIVEALATASSDNSVKAILLRVDSPGGSPVASEVIRNGIVKAKSKGKKVYVSMGSAAASGGYWISVNADRIYALPSTMTGSIGVVGGKFVFSGIWDKMGVNWDMIAVGGKNAGMWSINTPFSDEQMAIFARSMDKTYADFTSRVATGRKLSPEKVEEIARGRVWTGAQALKIGLVDGLMSYRQVQDQLLQDLGYKRAQVAFIQLPEPPNPFEALASALGIESQVRISSIMLPNVPREVSLPMQQLGVMQSVLQESGMRGAVLDPTVMMIKQ